MRKEKGKEEGEVGKGRISVEGRKKERGRRTGKKGRGKEVVPTPNKHDRSTSELTGRCSLGLIFLINFI